MTSWTGTAVRLVGAWLRRLLVGARRVGACVAIPVPISISIPVAAALALVAGAVAAIHLERQRHPSGLQEPCRCGHDARFNMLRERCGHVRRVPGMCLGSVAGIVAAVQVRLEVGRRAVPVASAAGAAVRVPPGAPVVVAAAAAAIAAHARVAIGEYRQVVVVPVAWERRRVLVMRAMCWRRLALRVRIRAVRVSGGVARVCRGPVRLLARIRRRACGIATAVHVIAEVVARAVSASSTVV